MDQILEKGFFFLVWGHERWMENVFFCTDYKSDQTSVLSVWTSAEKGEIIEGMQFAIKVVFLLLVV